MRTYNAVIYLACIVWGLALGALLVGVLFA